MECGVKSIPMLLKKFVAKQKLRTSRMVYMLHQCQKVNLNYLKSSENN